MRIPICLFEKEDLVYLRDRLGSLRRRGDCLVFSVGEWRTVLKTAGATLPEKDRAMRRLSLRLCAEFNEQRKQGINRQALLPLVESMVRLEPTVADWMLSKLDNGRMA